MTALAILPSRLLVIDAAELRRLLNQARPAALALMHAEALVPRLTAFAMPDDLNR
jgi:hypothetical protein